MLLRFIKLQLGKEFISTEDIRVVWTHKDKMDNKVFKMHNRGVGKIMSKLGFTDFATRNSAGTKRGYNLDFPKICEILVRQEWLSIKMIKKIVSEMSECQYIFDKDSNNLFDITLTSDVKEEKPSDVLTDLTLNTSPKPLGTNSFCNKCNAELVNWEVKDLGGLFFYPSFKY